MFEYIMNKRHFTVVEKNGKEHGLYVSSTPSSAAKKAVSKLCASNKSKKVEFYLREITQGSKKKTYGLYQGEMKKLKTPIELKGRDIQYKTIVHLNKGKKSTIKNSKKMSGGAITENDIMYKDNLVCILKPEIKKGILIYHSYNQPEDIPSLCSIGLKTGQLLHNEKKVNLSDKSSYAPYIFFRAPFFGNEIDYSSIESEIYSSFGFILLSNKIFIRVDPDNTYVFHSDDDISIKIYKIGNIKRYISLSSFLKYQQNKFGYEILVSKPHLTRDFFVKCYKDIPYEKNMKRYKIGRPLKLNQNWSPDKQKWVSPNYSIIRKPTRNEIARELLHKKIMNIKKEPNEREPNEREPNEREPNEREPNEREPINFSKVELVN